MTELQTYIQAYFGIPQEHLEKLAASFQETTLDKGEAYAKIGSYCERLSFIRSGYLRVSGNADGKDITQWIASPGEFIADLSSLVFKTPARWDIEALSPCSLYTISRENYAQIQTIVPQWEGLEKQFIAKCFLHLEDRVFSFLSMSAEERYHHFMTHKKELFNQVPLHYLASSLGMTPETLSRIRKKTTS